MNQRIHAYDAVITDIWRPPANLIADYRPGDRKERATAEVSECHLRYTRHGLAVVPTVPMFAAIFQEHFHRFFRGRDSMKGNKDKSPLVLLAFPQR
jgi:hypothetical protein